MDKKTLIDKIKNLNFPKGEYLVIGSWILSMLGIRESQDIDILVTKKLFNGLKKSWERAEHEKFGKLFLEKDVFEISNKSKFWKYNTNTEKLIEKALIIENIPFMNLDEFIKFKMALGREKDIQDIKFIKEYLNNQ